MRLARIYLAAEEGRDFQFFVERGVAGDIFMHAAGLWRWIQRIEIELTRWILACLRLLPAEHAEAAGFSRLRPAFGFDIIGEAWARFIVGRFAHGTRRRLARCLCARRHIRAARYGFSGAARRFDHGALRDDSFIIDAGRNHRHANTAFKRFVERRTQDDVGVSVDFGANLVRRIEDLTNDVREHENAPAFAGEEEILDAISVRMSALRDDATLFIDQTVDMAGAKDLARIIDATRALEKAAESLRVNSMRSLGFLLHACEALGKAMKDHPDSRAFVGGPESPDAIGVSFVIESTRHPGFWHYAVLDASGVNQSKKPIRLNAIPTALAMCRSPVGHPFRPITRESAPLDLFWPDEVAR